MALNIKDAHTERLAAEVAGLTGESKTGAIRVALEERLSAIRGRLPEQARGDRLRRFLELEAWPQMPDHVRGRTISKAERENILGYGPEGV